MAIRDTRDFVAGALMIGLGVFAAWYASSRYPLGSFSQMGPGMFPALVGYALVAVGVLICLPALYRARDPSAPVEWRPLVVVLVSVAAFAAAVTTLGVVPAIVLLTVGAVLADGRLGIVGTLVLAAVLVLVCVAIFHVLLGTPFVLFRWPIR